MTILMVQGTTSDAGKSTLVAGLCRVLVRRGRSVAPFKPQNMALNSAVTRDGGEIGRAQAVQAQACRLEPHTDMNPVLIKPASDTGAQIIIQGRALTNMQAQEFHAYKPVARTAVLESFGRLQQRHEDIVVEGAGSPAEINLREGDIANMGFAEAVDCPVILIADIDRGGVFAHIVGTLELLSASERQRVVGFVINRFRGDPALLQPGLDWLETHTGKPVLGVLPWLRQFHLDAEDAIGTEAVAHRPARAFKVVVPVLPRISNHTDFDALRLHPQVDLQWVALEQDPPACDLIILPGSKNVRGDLTALETHGWPAALARHLRYGGKVVGICGGLQMLGESIADPLGIEGKPGSSAGLGLLPLTTELLADKTLKRVEGTLRLLQEEAGITGYEIHHGRSNYRKACNNWPVEFSDGRRDGCLSTDGQILGTYCHGLMDQPAGLSLLLRWAGLEEPQAFDLPALREQQIERLADVLEIHLDFERLRVALTRFTEDRASCG